MPDLDSIFERYIGRIVAFVLAPILIPATAAVAAWLQDAIGIDLQASELAAFIVSVALGVSALLWQWLRGNAVFERAVIETHALYRAGQELAPGAAGDDSTPTVPPGIEAAGS